MIEIYYTPKFVRQYKSLDPSLKEELKEKIKLFRNRKNHKSLKVHKLHGELKDFHSFSVNYKIRIVFYWSNKNTAWLQIVGSHDLYK